MFSNDQPRSIGISNGTLQALIPYAGLFFCLLGIVYGPMATGGPLPEQAAERTKIAEGEYAIYERHNSGAVGPFQEEVYNFHESWTLWRTENGLYQVEGVRTFESPKDETHSNRFMVESYTQPYDNPRQGIRETEVGARFGPVVMRILAHANGLLLGRFGSETRDKVAYSIGKTVRTHLADFAFFIWRHHAGGRTGSNGSHPG